jgi:hypothetical protein
LATSETGRNLDLRRYRARGPWYDQPKNGGPHFGRSRVVVFAVSHPGVPPGGLVTGLIRSAVTLGKSLPVHVGKQRHRSSFLLVVPLREKADASRMVAICWWTKAP